MFLFFIPVIHHCILSSFTTLCLFQIVKNVGLGPLKFCRLPWISLALYLAMYLNMAMYKYGNVFVAACTFTVVTVVHQGYLHIPGDDKSTASNSNSSGKQSLFTHLTALTMMAQQFHFHPTGVFIHPQQLLKYYTVNTSTIINSDMYVHIVAIPYSENTKRTISGHEEKNKRQQC